MACFRRYLIELELELVSTALVLGNDVDHLISIFFERKTSTNIFFVSKPHYFDMSVIIFMIAD